jgi:hypothetical protein
MVPRRCADELAANAHRRKNASTNSPDDRLTQR